jgi:hypothetical protein
MKKIKHKENTKNNIILSKAYPSKKLNVKMYLPAKSTKLTTAPLAISLPAAFLLFWMKVMPTMVCAREEVAFMLVLGSIS